MKVRPPYGIGVFAFGVTMCRPVRGLLVAGIATTFAISVAAKHGVPLFPSAADPDRQGFVRIVNHASRAGTVRFFAIDDDGNRIGPREFTIDADEALHFNSGDLETGNPAKGLDPGTGPGSGDWRLEFESDLDIEVLAYVRTATGFLASMHEVLGVEDDDRQRLGLFKPAGDTEASSLLRLVNPGEESVDVRITGKDDAGEDSGEVVVSVAAEASRTLTAEQLETGAMLDGALGDGVGKWRLSVSVDGPVTTMNLMESLARQLVNLANALARVDESGTHHVPLFPGTSDTSGRKGLVRIINRSDRSGTVSIDATDARGDYEPVDLTIGANEAVQLDADDLETLGANAGFPVGTGPGTGRGAWLGLASDLDIEVLSYVRTGDGILAPMNTVAGIDTRHRLAVFNPGSNRAQVSQLRLQNPGRVEAEVTIAGVDDHGTSPGTGVSLTVSARQTRTLTAQELEAGGDAFEGSLGDGAGKWRLLIESDAPIRVMNLLASPTGHLTSLATVPANFAPANMSAFNDRVVGKRLVEAGGGSYIDFVSRGRYRETRNGQSTTGNYGYVNTGIATASMALEPDDGDECIAELAFESRLAGQMSRCDADVQSRWRVLSPSRRDADRITYEITAVIATLPSGTPGVVRDAVVSVVDRVVRIELANGGYVEAGEYRYTCWDAGGCVIDAGTVRLGRIRETPSVPVRDFDLPEDNRSGTGLAYHDGTFYVVDSADRRVYAYDRTGEHDLALSFDLAAATHTAAGIAFGDDRFYVVDELDILDEAPRKVFVYDELGAHIEDADFELHTALKDPLGIAFADGRLFIVDARTARVHAYSTAGERDADADFRLATGNDSPRGIAYGNGRFHVVDIFEDKVYVYRDNGERDANRDFELAGVNSFPRGIEVVDDAFYVVDRRRVFGYPADRPDLVVDTVSVDDARPGPGETFSLRATVRNVGHRRSGPTTLRYYRSTDVFIGTADEAISEGDVSGIDAGTSRRAVGDIEAPTASGRYHYGACVAALPDELDVANCSRAIQVTVPVDIGGATEGFILDRDNGNATGIAFADGRFFVLDDEDNKVYAYRATAERDADRDFVLDIENTRAEAIVHEDGKFYVVDRLDDKVYVYSTAGERDADADFDLHEDNASPNAIAYGNERFYVADLNDDKVYAYEMSGTRDARAGFGLSRVNDTPWAMEFVDDRLYVVDNVDDRVYVYDLDGDRDIAREFVLDFDNASPEGIVLFDDRFYVPTTSTTRSTATRSRRGRACPVPFPRQQSGAGRDKPAPTGFPP